MKMAQVTIRTNKYEEEVRFYQEIVGLQTQRQIHEGPLNIVFLADEKGDTCIEVIQTEGAETAGNPFLSIGFRTMDAERIRQQLRASGYDVSEMESPAPAVSFFFVNDPAGIRVQFVEERF